MKIIQETLNLLSCGAAVSLSNLSVMPLLTNAGNEPDYLTLDEALARGDVRVTETSEAGEVPELRLENRADQPVLLVDGEELVGAKQNRVLNLTILAPAKATITIPVLEPATMILISLSSHSAIVGLILNSPSIRATRTLAMGPAKGTSEIVRAADAPSMARVSGSFS